MCFPERPSNSVVMEETNKTFLVCVCWGTVLNVLLWFTIYPRMSSLGHNYITEHKCFVYFVNIKTLEMYLIDI